MDIIREFKKCGYQLSLEGKNIRYRKVKETNLDPEKVLELLEELKNRKPEVVQFLKSSNKEFNPGYAILCPYKGEPRWIHPAVCEWHREENDPECAKCDPKLRQTEKRTYH